MQRTQAAACCAAPPRASRPRRHAPLPPPPHAAAAAARRFAAPVATLRRRPPLLRRVCAAPPGGGDAPGGDAADSPRTPPPPPPLPPVSVWDSKPPWCQPWTILATGTTAVAGSWQLFHAAWLSVPVGAAVGLWWYIFLVAYPAQYAEYIAEAERRGINWREQQDYY